MATELAKATLIGKEGNVAQELGKVTSCATLPFGKGTVLIAVLTNWTTLVPNDPTGRSHFWSKRLRSFLVPSQGPKHKLSCLPLLQGSLPKNKGSSGNNFLRRIGQRGSKIHSSSKTSLFQKNRPRKFVHHFFFRKKVFSVEK